MDINARLARLALAASLALAWPATNAAIISFATDLTPEVLGATGSGSVLVEYDNVGHTLLIKADWTGLSGPTTVAHIHCCTAAPFTGTVGVAVTPVTLPGFPVGLTSGSYTSPLIDLDDTSSFTAAFLNNFGGGTTLGSINALLAGIDAGTAYFNVHSSTFPGGEIRGFLQRVPEPATISLLVFGLAGLLLSRRRLQ